MVGLAWLRDGMSCSELLNELGSWVGSLSETSVKLTDCSIDEVGADGVDCAPNGTKGRAPGFIDDFGPESDLGDSCFLNFESKSLTECSSTTISALPTLMGVLPCSDAEMSAFGCKSSFEISTATPPTRVTATVTFNTNR